MAGTIRKATEKDLPALEAVARAQGQPPGADDFARCLAEMTAGRRVLFLSLSPEGAPWGYVQLNRQPLYAPFRRMGIAEIQDLNVIPSQRRRGLGQALIETCEDDLRRAGADMVGISVGVTADFGPAQRLYAALGYRPDGAGICRDDIPVQVGAVLPIDADMTLKLVKYLAPPTRMGG